MLTLGDSEKAYLIEPIPYPSAGTFLGRMCAVIFPLPVKALTLSLVADLGEGPGGPGLPLSLGKKRRND